MKQTHPNDNMTPAQVGADGIDRMIGGGSHGATFLAGRVLARDMPGGRRNGSKLGHNLAGILGVAELCSSAGRNGRRTVAV